MDLDGGKLRYKIIGHEVDMLKSKLKPPPHPGLKLPSQEFAQLSAARTWYRVPTDVSKIHIYHCILTHISGCICG